MLSVLVEMVNPFWVPLIVITNGLILYEHVYLLLFMIQDSGKFSTLLAGVNYVGNVIIILEPLMTVELSCGSNDSNKGPKYP